MTWKDIVYILVTVSISLAINLSDLSITTILSINGTIFGFLFIYLLPISIHVKCTFFP